MLKYIVKAHRTVVETFTVEVEGEDYPVVMARANHLVNNYDGSVTRKIGYIFIEEYKKIT